MNSRYEAKLGMFTTVTNLNTSAADWATAASAKPILSTYRTQMLSVIGSITETASITEDSTIPITTNKAALRSDMEAKAASLAGMLYAYAKNHPDLILEEEVKPWKVKSAFTKLKDNITIAICLNIFNWASAVSPASGLTPYGVIADGMDPETDPGTITQLNNAIQAYDLVVANPETAIENRKAQNLALVGFFNYADDVLKNMDAAVYEFQFGSLVQFYNDYKAARTILDPVTTHTKIKGKITDAFTTLPIEGVKVLVTGSGPDLPNAVTVFTDVNGDYTVYTPKFKSNPYTAKASMAGYEDIIKTELYVKLGKPTTVNFTMITITP